VTTLDVSPNSKSLKVKQTLLPDLGDIIFLVFAQMMLFILPCLLFGDASTGWHLIDPSS
jgi:hypothetical protein